MYQHGKPTEWRNTMKMKATIATGLIIGFVTTTLGIIMVPFTNWRSLIDHTPDIVLASCTKTPDPYHVFQDGIQIDMRDGLIDSEIEIVSVLKGRTNLGPAKLTSQFWPRQGENYMVFSIFHNGTYNAIEPYSVVPLGVHFDTNIITGTNLDQQVRSLLRYRLTNLNRELDEGQQEKKRLEEGVKQ
jgi:hypothetical protein